MNIFLRFQLLTEIKFIIRSDNSSQKIIFKFMYKGVFPMTIENFSISTCKTKQVYHCKDKY